MRWFFDHCETISDRNIERVKALGGGIAVQHRMAYQGEYFIERYGSKAAARTPPVRRILEMGVPLGAGTDATRVASYNPWVCLGWLVTGKTVGGSQLYSDDNVLNREEALRLYTLGSAWFSREEERKGMLAPGLFADVAVLSADYFTVPEFKISRIESVLTIMDGKVVYGKDEFTKHAPPLPPPSPVWSPLLRYGGYGAPRYARGTMEFVPLHAREGSCGCRAPALSDACHLWGASGCDCFAF